ncbi:MAG: MATE family efflux transporter [Elainella sp.]
MHRAAVSIPRIPAIKAEIQACLALALPLAGAQLAQAATAFIDTIMMGLLGSATLAAGGLGAAFFQALVIISTNLLAAVSPLVATAYGAGEHQTVSRTLGQGFWLAASLTLPVALLLWLAGPIFLGLGQDATLVETALLYLRAIVWSVPALLGFAVLRHFVSALSDPRPVIWIMLAGTACNALGNYALALGKFGLPALGLAGIGWASTLSLWGMFLALALYVLIRPRYRKYRILQSLGRFNPAVFFELLRIGLPIGVLAAVETGMFTLTTFWMGQIGTTTLAAHQIAQQTAVVTFMVPLGISLATTVRVGLRLGQQDWQGAKLAGVVGIALSTLFMGAMGLLFWLMPERIVGLYLDTGNPANRKVVELAERLLGVAALFQIVDGIQVSASGALRGFKDTRVPMLIGIVAYWGIGLTSGYLLGVQLGLGAVGLWWGLALGLLVAALVLPWRLFALGRRGRGIGEMGE